MSTYGRRFAYAGLLACGFAACMVELGLRVCWRASLACSATLGWRSSSAGSGRGPVALVVEG
jgi:hypothetical protein